MGEKIFGALIFGKYPLPLMEIGVFGLTYPCGQNATFSHLDSAFRQRFDFRRRRFNFSEPYGTLILEKRSKI